VKQQRRRLFAGLGTAVVFTAILVGHTAGKLKIDEISLALIACVIGSVVFALSEQLGISKIKAGPVEIETSLPIKQAITELPLDEAEEVQRVLKKYSDLLPVVGVRLLWVDDCPETLIQYRQLLRRIGIEVIVARSTKDAIGDLKKDGDFTLVIQDRLRERSTEDAKALVEWFDSTEALNYRVSQIPIVVFSFDRFDSSIGVASQYWITKDFASLLGRILEGIKHWKKLPQAVQEKPFTY
jgi:hypothetical protein